MNGYHRKYTYSLRAVCPNCHNRRKIKNHLTRLNVCGIVMVFVAMVKIPHGVSKTSQSINYYETSTKNKWHVPEQLEILEYVCLSLTLHTHSASLVLPLFLKTTTTTTRPQRAAQQKRMWMTAYGIYFLIYIQRNFDFKRLIGLIDSDYILWVNKNNKNHRKTFCQWKMYNDQAS